MENVFAKLLIRNVQVYNSYFKQFYHADVSILDGKIYYVDTKRDTAWDAETEIDGGGKYMVPGLIDIHMHIESSMVTPSAFCDYVVGCGVTTIVSEPHEMANVNGLQGILDMISSGESSPIDVLYGIPSSVPSTSQELETTGGTITCQDMEALKENPAVACVGEVMNYRQVIKENDLEISKYIKKLRDSDKLFPIEGHCPALVDLDLAKFLYLGINGDHTEHSMEELRQRFAGGMFVEIQEKMLKAEVLEFIRQHNLYEHFCFVTDDVMTDTLCAQGHLDALVRQAIKLGLAPEQAIYNATYTPARRMNLLDRGSLAPGKLADFILLDDLSSFAVHSTYKNGHCVYHSEKAIAAGAQSKGFAANYYHSIKLVPPEEVCFRVPAPIGKDSVQVRVMEIADGSTKTTERIVEMPVREGFVDWINSGCMLAVVFERYGKNGGVGYGFLSGHCHKHGAVATSYAHDCHNVFVAGSNPEDMQLAVNRLIQLQGGMIVSDSGKLQAELQLNIGGIISGNPVTEVGAALSSVRSAMISQGYNHYNPIMSFCTITLPVSPNLKLTDRGLIDVTNSTVVPLYLE